MDGEIDSTAMSKLVGKPAAVVSKMMLSGNSYKNVELFHKGSSIRDGKGKNQSCEAHCSWGVRGNVLPGNVLNLGPLKLLVVASGMLHVENKFGLKPWYTCS